MTQPTQQTYRFSTFQELFERVPADRIADCMCEMGIVFARAKSMQKMILEVAKAEAVKTGVEWPSGAMFDFNEEHEWVDDGLGKLDVRFIGPDGNKILEVNMEPTTP